MAPGSDIVATAGWNGTITLKTKATLALGSFSTHWAAGINIDVACTHGTAASCSASAGPPVIEGPRTLRCTFGATG